MAKRKVTVSRPLSEMVKGSYDYATSEVAQAFAAQFAFGADNMPQDLWIVETFPDAVIVREYGRKSGAPELGPDEFYRVTYTKDGDGKIVFAARETWEPVELVYQARTEPAEQPPMAEGRTDQNPPAQRRRLEERVAPRAELAEGNGGNGQTRRIRIAGLMQAGVINGNGRRYPAHVLEAAVAEWRDHLHESAGQGRLKILTGEVEHPGDKGKRGAQFLETVVQWTDVTFDGANVDVAGELILTTTGRDVATLMESGVRPGGSVRGFYEAKVGERGRPVGGGCGVVPDHGGRSGRGSVVRECGGFVGEPSHAIRRSGVRSTWTEHSGDDEMDAEEAGGDDQGASRDVQGDRGREREGDDRGAAGGPGEADPDGAGGRGERRTWRRR